MDNKYDLLELLDFINPSMLNYQEWVNVGMALKLEGYNASDWEAWSMKDSDRYHPGECEKKWQSFSGSDTPVTAGTLVKMAKDGGWNPPEKENYEIDWDGVIGAKDDLKIIDKNWIERKELKEPKRWNPVKQLIKYLETLFDGEENVGYVTECYESENGRFLPKKGAFDRTANELIQALRSCNGDIGAVIGDYNTSAGAWIRFNPLDGKDVTNSNITDYRYALVESDKTDMLMQNAIIRELELPVAALVHSGGKSIHAIVRIDAGNYDEYRKRVDYLYSVCNKNGLCIDSQNRNPSRLSRMPGIIRNGKKQYLIDTNIGKANFTEWKEWIESVNDDLPNPENMSDLWENMPELAPPLIDGVLRQGHKMLIAGPSKAGKSYALIELCCAIAEGQKWFGWQCTQGRVMYVNLELDRASCLHRFKDVYTALGFRHDNINNIDIWNLRGKSIPMDKLAPKLIRRASRNQYIAIVIDPIYKIITGDENSADQMANFCNQFDKVCTELGCAVIYCHHHSKGAQGGKKSMDRASGSGVFARDPDALLDLLELETTDNIIKQLINNEVCKLCKKYLIKYGYEDCISQDDECSQTQMIALCKSCLPNDGEPYEQLLKDIAVLRKEVSLRTAWRIEGTLREFPRFEPVNAWFEYPIHRIEHDGALKDIDADNGVAAWKKAKEGRKTKADKEKERKNSIETAYEACKIDGEVTVKAISEYLGKTEKTVRNMLKEHGGFWVDNCIVGEK